MEGCSNLAFPLNLYIDVVIWMCVCVQDLSHTSSMVFIKLLEIETLNVKVKVIGGTFQNSLCARLVTFLI